MTRSTASAPPDLFGPDWAERLERELGASGSYRAAAASWKGSLLFVLDPDGTPGFESRRTLFLDLAHGSARAVRPALGADAGAASHWLEAPAATWIRLLSGDLDPGSAIVSGALKLSKGSMFWLLPHLGAAKSLLACAQNVPFAAPRAGALS